MKLHIKPKAGSSGFLPWPWSLPSGQAKNKGSFFKQGFINVTTKALMKTSRPWRKPHGLKRLAPHRLARKAQLSLSHTGTSDQLFSGSNQEDEVESVGALYGGSEGDHKRRRLGITQSTAVATQKQKRPRRSQPRHPATRPQRPSDLGPPASPSLCSLLTFCSSCICTFGPPPCLNLECSSPSLRGLDHRISSRIAPITHSHLPIFSFRGAHYYLRLTY